MHGEKFNIISSTIIGDRRLGNANRMFGLLIWLRRCWYSLLMLISRFKRNKWHRSHRLSCIPHWLALLHNILLFVRSIVCSSHHLQMHSSKLYGRNTLFTNDLEYSCLVLYDRYFKRLTYICIQSQARSKCDIKSIERIIINQTCSKIFWEKNDVHRFLLPQNIN